MDLPISSRIFANQWWLEAYKNQQQIILVVDYCFAVFYWQDVSFVLRISCIEDKMATQILTGYEPRTVKLFFDDNESKYKLWEVKFLGYLRIQHLH